MLTILRLTFAAAALFVGPGAAGAAGVLPRGEVVPRVECLARPQQSYALYLPSGYRSDRRWPILYAFDPRGRGEVPVVLFRQAAETYGWIVVGSNNSRNGPMAPIREAVQSVWEDTQTRLSIDPRRVYATGMSGGGAPALALAGEAGAGVVLCASAPGWRPNQKHALGYAMVAIAGLRDFNYPEMELAAETAAKNGAPAYFLSFDGRHDWPPGDLALAAVQWLERQALQSGRRAPDPLALEALRAAAEARVQSLRGSGRHAEAMRELQAMDGCSADSRERAARLGKEKVVRRELHSLRRMTEWQWARQAELLALRRAAAGESDAATDPPCDAPVGIGEADCGPASRMHARGRLLADLEQMRARSQRRGAEPDPDAVVARRVLDWMAIVAHDAGLDQLTKGDAARAAVTLEIAARARPEISSVHFAWARALAGAGRGPEAVAELRRAVEEGHSSLAALDREPAFLALRQRPDFIALRGELATAKGVGATPAAPAP